MTDRHRGDTVKDNLDQAQHCIDSPDAYDPTEAAARALIDIARSLRAVETWVNETGFGGSR